MSKLRTLSGKQIIKIFESFGFSVAYQRGSHVKLRRVSANGINQTLTVPDHKVLDRGTVHAIFTQAQAYISDTELRPHFYTV